MINGLCPAFTPEVFTQGRILLGATRSGLGECVLRPSLVHFHHYFSLPFIHAREWLYISQLWALKVTYLIGPHIFIVKIGDQESCFRVLQSGLTEVPGVRCLALYLLYR